MITKELLLQITNKELDKFKYPSYYSEILSDYDKQYFFEKSGAEHYRLLSKLSTLLDDDLIFDIGTHFGGSCLALAYNQENMIVTYDLEEYPEAVEVKEKYKNGNLTFKIGNVLESPQLLQSSLIFIDIDHLGSYEKNIVDYLTKNNYIGITIWDDILLNEHMRDFWYNYAKELEHIDLTHLGHWSGTGVIIFK